MRLPSRYPTLSSSLHIHIEPTTIQNDGSWPTSLVGGERPTFVVVAGKVCHGQQQACVYFFLRVMASTQAPIWKDHEQEDDFAPNPHTACLEIDYILSSLALLCVLYTSPKLKDQMLPLGEVLNSNNVGVMTTK